MVRCPTTGPIETDAGYFEAVLVVSEAVAHLLHWMYRLWIMLPVTTVIVFATSARSPRVLGSQVKVEAVPVSKVT